MHNITYRLFVNIKGIHCACFLNKDQLLGLTCFENALEGHVPNLMPNWKFVGNSH